MRRKTLTLVAAVAAALALLAAILLCVLFLAKSPVDKNTPDKAIRIDRGSSAGMVAALLHDEGLVKSPALFQLALRLAGADRKLKAGTYRIEGGTSIWRIVGILSEGRVSQAKVTIPEGSTLGTIGDALEKAGICSRKDFEQAASDAGLAARGGVPGKSFEGFLFPDTYSFPEDSDPETVLLAMAANFFRKLETIAPIGSEGRGSLYENVILASIVEREYREASVAGQMASVFKNRLAIGMALQSCATVVYVITEKLGKPHPKVVYYSDLAIPSPYNTYLHRGLPPAPISNPGETALKAVFNSPESDYLYFRLIDEAKGLHRFSRTFEEHTGEAIPVKGF